MGRIKFAPNEIFVFGSNLAGIHGAGSALHARKHFGAERYIGIGLQGHSYAIPTKDERLRVLPLTKIQEHVNTFLEVARARPDLIFKIVPIGCGLAGYTPNQIAPMFRDHPSNCFLPREFIEVL
jgi:hypothetical protein